MRTTINLDDDIFMAVKSVARARGVPVGRALSDLVRRGLERSSEYTVRNDLPVFQVREDAPIVTPEQVDRSEDEP
ncbi:MAG: hypothetical protein GF331_13675 [Chitinivibrionales bacterium]|nr:hypothetical protein [Chitinivibrionales bacterium]